MDEQLISQTVVRMIQRGRDRLREGHADDAAALLTQALEREKSAAAYASRSDAHYRAGAADKALEDLNEALSIAPTLAALWLKRGKLLMALNEPESASADFGQAIKLERTNDAAFSMRAMAYMQLGHTREALRDLTSALELAPQNPGYYFFRGGILRQLGNPSGAIADLSQAIALRGDHPFSYDERGLAYLESGNMTEASADFQHALDLERTPERCYHLGKCLIDSGKAAESLRLLKEAVSGDPSLAEAYAELGRASGLLDNPPDADRYFAKSLQLCRDAHLTWYYQSEYRLNHKKWEQAVQDATRAIELQTDHQPSYRIRSTASQELGDFTTALADLQQLMAFCGSDTKARIRLESEIRKLERVASEAGVKSAWSVRKMFRRRK